MICNLVFDSGPFGTTLAAYRLLVWIRHDFHSILTERLSN